MPLYLVVILKGFESKTHFTTANNYTEAEKWAINKAGGISGVLLCKLIGSLEK